MEGLLTPYPPHTDIPVIVTRRGATFVRSNPIHVELPTINSTTTSSPTNAVLTTTVTPTPTPPTNQEHIEELSLEEKLDFFNRVVKVPISLIEKDSNVIVEPLSKQRDYEFQVATMYVKDAINGRDIHHRVDKVSLVFVSAISIFHTSLVFDCFCKDCIVYSKVSLSESSMYSSQ